MPNEDEPRGSRRWIAVIVVVALAAAGVVVAGSGVLTRGSGGGGGAGDNGFATSLYTVARRTLSTQTQFAGTLGYAGSYAVMGRTSGTVTWLPPAGQVVDDGEVLYRVDGAPVVLLHGSTPAYRTLSVDAVGTDVAQLNRDLVALGYVPRSAVRAWDEFSPATRHAVALLQKHLGVGQSGALELGTAVFLPTTARVTALQATLGGPAAGRVLTATTTTRTVSVELDTSLQGEVSDGDRVTISLPNGRSTPGAVTSVGRVATAPADTAAGSGSTPTVPVTIRPTDPAATGSYDEAPVDVSITGRTVHDVLAVPVDALLALAGGGYALEIVGADGSHRLTAVTPGLFDDGSGLVQVTGSGLATGQRVVVPGHA